MRPVSNVGPVRGFRTVPTTSEGVGMQAEMPFFEGAEDALRHLVQAMGGAKAVGARLWPDRTPEAAGRLLLDCLNGQRSEKLGLGQVLLLLRWGHEAGHHTAMHWLAAEAGYEARAVTRAEERDRLAVVVEQSTRALSAAVAALQRLQQPEGGA